MSDIPVPEIAALLVILLVSSGFQMLWRKRRRAPLATSGGGSRDGSLDGERLKIQMILASFGIALIATPLVLNLVPPNGVYGFRTSFVRSSPMVWYAANAFSGWALLVAAAVSVTLQLLMPIRAKRWLRSLAFVAPVLGAAIASFVYVARMQ